MAKQDEKVETDADGIAVQRYEALVLVVVPAQDFAEQTLRHTRSALANVHVGTRVVSTRYDELVQGRLQDEFLVDGTLAQASMDDYAGVVFVGGEGALALADDQDAQRLAREASAAGKTIAAWGHSTAILAKAGVVKRRKLTGHPAVRELVERAGGRFTGRQLERDRNFVSAQDEAVGMRFGKSVAQVVRL